MITPNIIHDKIAAVCPIGGISFVDFNDRSTWLVDYLPQATEQQKSAAAALIASYDALSDKKAELKKKVDDDAESVRLRYITPGAGMAMTYQEKKDQAVAVIAMGETASNALLNHGAAEFPTLSASVPVEAQTLFAAAQLVMSRYEAWAALSRAIESARMTGKKAIGDASDAAAAQAAYEAITWPTA